MADTNVRVIVDAIDNASNVLKNLGKNIEDTLGKQTQTNVGGLSTAMEGAVGTFGKLAVGAGVAGAVIAGVSIGVQKLAEGFNTLMEAAAEHERVNAQTNAVLQSTGDISGATSESVRKLGESIEATTPIAHDNAQAAENMLLTFTSIGHTILPQATEAVINMATAMNGGLVPSQQQLIDTSIQVGKALNDPSIGLLNLRREGVEFTNDQKKVIEALIDTGHGAEAQQMILAELNKEFGGSAAASMDTYSGAMQNLHNKVSDLTEGIGNALSPAIQMLAGDAASTLDPAISGTAANMQVLQAYAIALAGSLEVLGEIAVGAAQAMWAAFSGGDVLKSVEGTVNQVGKTIQETQDKIYENQVRANATMEESAKATMNGAAVASSGAASKAASAMANETETYLRELAKRNQNFEDSLTQMVQAHIKKKNQLVQDLADENSAYAEASQQRLDDFKAKMDEMVQNHNDKVTSIEQQEADETASFQQNMQDQVDSFKESMESMKDAHDSKVTKLQRDLDKEAQFGNMANDAKALDLKQQIDDENTAYAKQQADAQAKEDKAVAKLQEADTKKLTTLQTELKKENDSYLDAEAKAEALEKKQTEQAQDQHDKRVKALQDQLDQENALLNKHAAEVKQVGDQAAEDDITRLEKTHAQENADALAQHLQKMKDIPAQEAQVGSAGGVAYGDAVNKKVKEAMDERKKQEDAAHKASTGGWLQAGITAGENLLNGLRNGMEGALKKLLGNKAGGIASTVIETALNGLFFKSIGLPGFQAGGVVPGSIGQPVPILAHGGEYVTPVGAGNKSGGGAGVTFNVNIGMYAGTETEKRNLAKSLYASILDMAQSQHKTVQEYMGG